MLLFLTLTLKQKKNFIEFEKCKTSLIKLLKIALQKYRAKMFFYFIKVFYSVKL